MTSTIRDELNIITVVLGADTKRIRGRDSIELIEYVYSNYEYVNVKELIEKEFNQWDEANRNDIYINKGVTDKIDIKMGDSKYEKYPVKKEEIKDIIIEIDGTKYLEAPVEKGTTIGKIVFRINDDIIEEIDIKTCEEIRKKNVLDYFYGIVSNYDIILENVIINK